VIYFHWTVFISLRKETLWQLPPCGTTWYVNMSITTCFKVGQNGCVPLHCRNGKRVCRLTELNPSQIRARVKCPSYCLAVLVVQSLTPVLYSKRSLTLKEWRFNLSFPWVSMLFLNSWRVSVIPYYVTTHSPAIQIKTALTLKKSSDWTSTHWVWVSF
jgi:hypothetical protein